ncbi:hypothetical protein J6590_039896 [Homalodisca vitripennis]|nr:hypothetical protein J6590_039896 [Homalodisca vitripennis]
MKGRICEELSESKALNLRVRCNTVTAEICCLTVSEETKQLKIYSSELKRIAPIKSYPTLLFFMVAVPPLSFGYLRKLNLNKGGDTPASEAVSALFRLFRHSQTADFSCHCVTTFSVTD